mgnify:CR=1 FL=1
MMRGTVYLVGDDPDDGRTIKRDVFASDDTTVDEFRMSAANFYVNDSPLRRDWRIEFGPIGPPWRVSR